MSIETCVKCDEPTGRAGVADDSLFTDSGKGPFCEDCFDEVEEANVCNEVHRKGGK